MRPDMDWNRVTISESQGHTPPKHSQSSSPAIYKLKPEAVDGNKK